jgi:transposase
MKSVPENRGGWRAKSRTPLLKKVRWLLPKREENLKEEQRFRLRDLLRYSLKTVRAYLLKEARQQLWEYNSPAWAGKFSRRVVPPNHAFPHRAHEEDRPLGFASIAS